MEIFSQVYSNARQSLQILIIFPRRQRNVNIVSRKTFGKFHGRVLCYHFKTFSQFEIKNDATYYKDAFEFIKIADFRI